MKSITVFTPTYNRAYCLHQVYDSLVAQTCPDFIWMVVDDGSTDGTQTLVDGWIAAGKIEITYLYKPNGGMHTAHNTAYRHITTPYNTCIDSDDFMPADAIAVILSELKGLADHFAGLVGLDADSSGKIIGSKIPESVKQCRLFELYGKYGVTGDKKLVYKTEVVNQYPDYPEFPDERFVPLGYKYLLIDQDYLLKPINEVLCVVEYQEDGSSKNILRQYRRNPKGFAFSRIERIKLSQSSKDTFRNSVHLVSSAIFANDYQLVFRSPAKALALAAIPFGVLLNLYIRFKTKAGHP